MSGRTLSPRLKAAGVVGTAVVVGFVGVLVLQGGSSAATNGANRTGFGGPPGAGQAFGGPQGSSGSSGPAGGFGPPGGFAARGLTGTVSAVSSSSITVGGTTVKVTSTTEVVVNGARGALTDVTRGATVFVHTEGSGSNRYAERIFVGGPPQGGPGGQPGGPPGNGPTSAT